MTVGWREVAAKQRRLRAPGPTPAAALRPTPAVLGPAGTAYALDRHHTLCAMIAEGMRAAPVRIVEDLRHLPEAAFWRLLDRRGWCHPYDPAGVRQPSCKMPRRFTELANDPFRDLAGALRHGGGYTKTDGLFSEFLWADYMRHHISPERVLTDFSGAVQTALELASQPEARSLPGWFAAPLLQQCRASAARP